MSGGRWEYRQERFAELLEDVLADGDAAKRWPRTLDRVQVLGDALYKVLHDMDWALSGDTDPDKLIDDEMADRLK